jgi:putative DNA primase/helicase
MRGKDGRPKVVPSLARKIVESLMGRYDATLPPPPVWRTPDKKTKLHKPGDGFLVVGNGILDIAAAARNPRGRKVLLPHTPDFFATGMSAHLYLPKDRCPKFDKYLITTFPDEGARNLFQQALGWLISGDRAIPNFLVLYGHKGTGKGVCVAIARALVGEGNHCSVPLHRFANPYVVGALAQYKANLVDEAPAGSIICERDKERGVVEGIIKQATGGYDARIMDDTKHVDSKGTTARRVKAANWFAFNPPFPSFKDPAIFDRIRALVFEQRFRNTRAEDVHLAEFIVYHEMSGVLNRALEGVEMLGDAKKLPEYDAGREIVRGSRCRVETDALALWMDERCEAKPGAFTSSAELFADWTAWSAGLELAPISDNAFSLKVRGVWRDLSTEKQGGIRGLRGIVLKPIEGQNAPPRPEEPDGRLGRLSAE